MTVETAEQRARHLVRERNKLAAFRHALQFYEPYEALQHTRGVGATWDAVRRLAGALMKAEVKDVALAWQIVRYVKKLPDGDTRSKGGYGRGPGLVGAGGIAMTAQHLPAFAPDAPPTPADSPWLDAEERSALGLCAIGSCETPPSDHVQEYEGGAWLWACLVHGRAWRAQN